MIMIMGYGIIAVPTGLVTAQVVSETMHARDRRRCRACGRAGHERDADFCRHCGEQLR
jgi:voltage-gated potassium channel